MIEDECCVTTRSRHFLEAKLIQIMSFLNNPLKSKRVMITKLSSSGPGPGPRSGPEGQRSQD